MIASFNPAIWYWGPNGSNQYFSSASLSFVAANNATLVAWQAAGNVATKFTSLADLREILRPYGIGTRTLPSLYTALTALSATQKANINTQLFTGGPPLPILLDTGPNAVALAALYAVFQIASLGAADVTLLKLHATALYVQDHPNYLVQPSWDATINMAGTTF